MVTRRKVLRLGGLLLAGSAGCLSQGERNQQTPPAGTEKPTELATEPQATLTDTPQDTPTEIRTRNCPPKETPSGGASLAIRNSINQARQGNVSVTRVNGGDIFEDRFELEAGEGRLEQDVFTVKNDYKISLSTDSGKQKRWMITLPDENQEPLSTYTVEIDFQDEIQLLILHGDPSPSQPGC